MGNVEPARPVWGWRIIVVVMLVAAGACANVMVAWTCCLRCAVDPQPGIFPVAPWPASAPESWPPTAFVLRRDGWGVREFQATAPPVRGEAALGVTRQWVMHAGWPRHSMAAHRSRQEALATTHSHMSAEPARSWDGGIEIPGFIIRPVNEERLIPTRPLAKGFIINTATYAAGAGLVIAAARAAQRGLWRRRSRCTGCGYAVLGAAICPECGRRQA